ncbi:MAG: bifunctional 4-hydroxy-3-methylbut-2-enyl diphosphate reductase/30S ribosomal protein S1 [Oscillospiraceae bacterium]|nr:bifunctional 4-hydroxy-3-methylbut-2-enyl diphosphate reductase/30S ribosomal protein S1 [Oscillospiraceae bacterium]
MKITLAKTAGFCFGVKRAVDLTYNLAGEDKKVATLGELIHNKQLVADLEKQGVITLENTDVPAGYEVVIRSHGIVKSVYDELSAKGVITHDATCPYVKKIHKLAEKNSADGKILLVMGDEKHPEVQGIVSYSSTGSVVFAEPCDLEKWLEQGENSKKACALVAQTTYMLKKWQESVNIIKKVCTNCEIFDTICRATQERQMEAEALAKKSDAMVVIGGKHSSNTQKLVDVCRTHCKTISIETGNELSPELFINIQNVGVTAGASTPAFIIQEVLNNMSDMNRDLEMDFGAMLAEFEGSEVKLHRNAVVSATVESVTAKEIIVSVPNCRYTGTVKASEFSADPSAKLEELVKKGDELTLIVIKTDDNAGEVQLSKKRLDEREGEGAVEAAAQSGEVLTAKIAEAVNGGLVAFVKGVRVFIPKSLAAGRNENLEDLVKTEQQIKIIECSRDGGRRKVIGSIKAVKDAATNELKEKFWAEVEEGKHYTGTVKSLTKYGAFVDIGGVDGLVHMSEITWEKIKHPAEVLTVGQEIDVFVKSLDREAGKVSLGHKKEEDNPWAKFETEYPIGTIFTAKVVSITKFGAFVKILPGVDGLVHISEIAWERVEDPNAVLKVGEEVQVKLIGVDLEAKRVSLSIKQTKEAPAKEEAAEEAVEATEEVAE